jgi:hypothetical protein
LFQGADVVSAQVLADGCLNLTIEGREGREISYYNEVVVQKRLKSDLSELLKFEVNPFC